MDVVVVQLDSEWVVLAQERNATFDDSGGTGQLERSDEVACRPFDWIEADSAEVCLEYNGTSVGHLSLEAEPSTRIDEESYGRSRSLVWNRCEYPQRYAN